MDGKRLFTLGKKTIPGTGFDLLKYIRICVDAIVELPPYTKFQLLKRFTFVDLQTVCAVGMYTIIALLFTIISTLT